MKQPQNEEKISVPVTLLMISQILLQPSGISMTFRPFQSSIFVPIFDAQIIWS